MTSIPCKGPFRLRPHRLYQILTLTTVVWLSGCVTIQVAAPVSTPEASNHTATPVALAATATSVGQAATGTAIAVALMDADSDGLTSSQEASMGTSPDRADSDDDGLIDGLEMVNQCDPLNPDTDVDNLPDGEEINQVGTACQIADTDGDGLRDDQDAEPLRVGVGPTLVSAATAAPNECLDAPPLQLTAPSLARVLSGGDGSGSSQPPLRLRSAPGTSSAVIDEIPVQSSVRILEGPRCGDDGRMRWWLVEWNAQKGWVADGVDDVYFLEPQ